MIKAVDINLDFGENKGPFVIKIDDVQKDLNVFIGQNGSGKTMVLVCMWFMGVTLQLFQTLKKLSPRIADRIFGETVSDLISMTFDGYKNMSGHIMFWGHQSNFEFRLYIQNGKLENFDIDIEDPEAFIKMPITKTLYNSKEARQFTAYERYLQLLELVDIKIPLTIKDFKKVTKLHKLFDIMWFEHVRLTLTKWEKNGVSEEASKRISNFHVDWSSDFDEFGTNPHLVIRDDIPWIESDTIKQKFSEFGSGHQAVLMTTLFV